MYSKIRPINLLNAATMCAVLVIATVCVADEEKPKFPTVQACVLKEKQTDQASKEGFDCGEIKGSIKVKSGPIDVKYSNGTTQPLQNAISITYTGKNCADCVWVQFIWRKIVVTFNDGTKDVEKVLDGKAKVPYSDPKGGKEQEYSYELTTDERKDPKWNVDSPHYGTDPTYSANKGCIQASECPTTNLVADFPTSLFGYNKKSWKLISSYTLSDASEKNLENATKVRALLHAETFLVCKGKVCAKVSWNASWSIDVKKDGTINPTYFPVNPVYSDATIDPGAKPTDAQMTALNDQFKGQNVLEKQ